MTRLPRPPLRLAPALLSTGVALAACGGGAMPPTAVPSAGTEAAPREIVIIAKDYLFLPPSVALIPGETVLIHVVNGGLALHEVVIGDARVQQAWESAEATTGQGPPGPTPAVSVPPDVAGLRVVVRSGERVDVRYRVPQSAADVVGLMVGCHIPGHWAKGMQVPVVAVDPSRPPATGG